MDLGAVLPLEVGHEELEVVPGVEDEVAVDETCLLSLREAPLSYVQEGLGDDAMAGEAPHISLYDRDGRLDQLTPPYTSLSTAGTI